MNVFYTMSKSAWNAQLGDYSSTEIQTGPLTLAQVRGRVARLPTTTDWLWNIDKWESDILDGCSHIIGFVSADEFDGDVETF